MALNTRQPTGKAPWPILLVEGAEKAGKSFLSLSLSASERIANSHLFEIGERTGDSYARLGDYEIVELDGTWTTFIDQYGEAVALPRGEHPNLNVVDSGTVLWEGLKDWISGRAANSNANKQLLQRDPDAAITIGNNLWNDANSRWGQFMRLTKAHKGVTIITARSKITAKIGPGGSPVAGQTDYKIEAQKDLPNHVSAIIRCEGPGKARLMAAWDLDLDIPPAGLLLPTEGALEHVVFDLLGTEGFGDQQGSDPSYGRLAGESKAALVDMFTKANTPDPTGAAQAIWLAGPCPAATKGDEVSDEQWAALVAAADVAISELEADQ